MGLIRVDAKDVVVNPNISSEDIDTTTPDFDGDGVSNLAEILNGTKVNSADSDGDTVSDKEDAFRKDKIEWSDLDGDGIGDNKDDDRDGDGFTNIFEQETPGLDPNNPDVDGDGVKDGVDNCFLVSNKDQADFDTDKQGNACDDDDDNDLLSDNQESLEGTNSLKSDTDDDGLSDSVEGATSQRGGVYYSSPTSANTDGDSAPDALDAFPSNNDETRDQDGDGVGDNADNCVAVANSDQENNDGGSEAALRGDACDDDDDNDGLTDVVELDLNDGFATDPFKKNSDPD